MPLPRSSPVHGRMPKDVQDGLAEQWHTLMENECLYEDNIGNDNGDDYDNASDIHSMPSTLTPTIVTAISGKEDYGSRNGNGNNEKFATTHQGVGMDSIEEQRKLLYRDDRDDHDNQQQQQQQQPKNDFLDGIIDSLEKLATAKNNNIDPDSRNNNNHHDNNNNNNNLGWSIQDSRRRSNNGDQIQVGEVKRVNMNKSNNSKNKNKNKNNNGNSNNFKGRGRNYRTFFESRSPAAPEHRTTGGNNTNDDKNNFDRRDGPNDNESSQPQQYVSKKNIPELQQQQQQQQQRSEFDRRDDLNHHEYLQPQQYVSKEKIHEQQQQQRQRQRQRQRQNKLDRRDDPNDNEYLQPQQYASKEKIPEQQHRRKFDRRDDPNYHESSQPQPQPQPQHVSAEKIPKQQQRRKFIQTNDPNYHESSQPQHVNSKKKIPDEQRGSTFDVVAPPPPINFQRTHAWNVDKSLLDTLSPQESQISQEKRFFEQKTTSSTNNISIKKSSMKQSYPPPATSPNHADNILGSFIPSTCGGRVNGDGPVDSVLNFFDTPGRLNKSYRSVNSRSSAPYVVGSGPSPHLHHHIARKACPNGLRSSSNESRSGYSQETKRMSGSSRHSPESSMKESGGSKLPKTESQKRHELEMLRVLYPDMREDTVSFKKKSSNGSNSGVARLLSDLSNGNTSRQTQESIDFSIHDAIWGSESSDSATAMSISKAETSAARGPRHSTGGMGMAKVGNKYSRARAALSPKHVKHIDSSTAVPALAAMKTELSARSGSQGVATRVDEFLFDQLKRCSDDAHIESSPRQSKLYPRDYFKGELKSSSDTKNKESNAVSFSPAFNVFEEIHRQLTGKAKLDSSGFPTESLNDTTTQSSKLQQEQRLQEKLDAVRVRSIRNAEKFQQLLDNEKKEHVCQDGQPRNENGTGKSPCGSDNFGEGYTNQVPSTDQTTDRQCPQGKLMAGKRLDHLFDKTTEKFGTAFGEDLVEATSRATSATSGVSTSISSSSPSQQRNHYMYVAYSRFGQDARKVLQLCEHHSMPTPNRRNNEVLIRVHASTISASDCAIRRGEWSNISMDPYIVPGVALVGIVTESDKKKTRTSFSFSSPIQPGDVVLALATSGANARYTCLPRNQLVKIPPQLNPDLAVCLTETYLTAFQALHIGQKGGLRYRENSLKGQSILITGGYSPLGKALIELCRAGDAEFCYALTNQSQNKTKKSKKYRGGSGSSSSSDDSRHQCEAMEQWGAIPLSNNPQDWLTLIGRQIDMLVTVCDPSEHAQCDDSISGDHWKVLRKDGQVVVVSTHPGMNEADQRDKLFGSPTAQKINGSSVRDSSIKAFRIPSCRPSGRDKLADRAIWYNLFDSLESDRGGRSVAKKDLEHLVHLLQLDLVHPEVVEHFPLSRVAKAQIRMEQNKVTGVGHLICSPWLMEQTPRKQTAKEETNEQTQLTGDTVLL
jgi:NADPH:quinone reductase-like Zn-dependent oxidoreductase